MIRSETCLTIGCLRSSSRRYGGRSKTMNRYSATIFCRLSSGENAPPKNPNLIKGDAPLFKVLLRGLWVLSKHTIKMSALTGINAEQRKVNTYKCVRDAFIFDASQVFPRIIIAGKNYIKVSGDKVLAQFITPTQPQLTVG